MEEKNIMIRTGGAHMCEHKMETLYLENANIFLLGLSAIIEQSYFLILEYMTNKWTSLFHKLQKT